MILNQLDYNTPTRRRSGRVVKSLFIHRTDGNKHITDVIDDIMVLWEDNGKIKRYAATALEVKYWNHRTIVGTGVVE